MEKISVFISDWQVLFREGIHFVLSGEEEFDIIGEATNNEEALSAIEKNPPKVAIFNADRDKPSGIEITRRIKQNLPAVVIILIMDNYNDEQLFLAMKSGASACLSKDVNPDELLDIIRKVVRGEHPISGALLIPEVASRIIDEFEAFSVINEEVGQLLARLLPDEAEILRLIASGNLIEEITKGLKLQEADVRNHLDLILGKLVTNERSRELIEAAQSNLPSILSKISGSGKLARSSAQYVTKDEFSNFKEELIERIKSLFGELK
ncbi:response regulator [Chloroflexota bacterium]